MAAAEVATAPAAMCCNLRPMPTQRPGFVPPPYPYDRLDDLAVTAGQHEGGTIDLSVGTPCDPPPQVVLDAFANSNA